MREGWGDMGEVSAGDNRPLIKVLSSMQTKISLKQLKEWVNIFHASFRTYCLSLEWKKTSPKPPHPSTVTLPSSQYVRIPPQKFSSSEKYLT